jgi:hypothetical protein
MCCRINCRHRVFLITMGSIIAAISSIMPLSNDDNKLVILLSILPFQGHGRFFVYLGDTVLMRLCGCCRSLRNMIVTGNSFRRQLYRDKFLHGPHDGKELDFVYWCARTGSLINTLPSAITSDVLGILNWFDTYRRRICMEHN